MHWDGVKNRPLLVGIVPFVYSIVSDTVETQTTRPGPSVCRIWLPTVTRLLDLEDTGTRSWPFDEQPRELAFWGSNWLNGGEEACLYTCSRPKDRALSFLFFSRLA